MTTPATEYLSQVQDENKAEFLSEEKLKNYTMSLYKYYSYLLEPDVLFG